MEFNEWEFACFPAFSRAYHRPLAKSSGTSLIVKSNYQSYARKLGVCYVDYINIVV